MNLETVFGIQMDGRGWRIRNSEYNNIVVKRYDPDT